MTILKIKLADGTERDETAEEATTREKDTTKSDKVEDKVISPEEQARQDAEYWKRIALQQKELIDRVSTRQDTVERKVEEVSKPAAPSKDDLNKQFWTDPTTVVRGMLDEMIKPLTDFVGQTKATTAYDRIKQELRNDPSYARILNNPKAEAVLDQLMQSQKEINRDTVSLAIMSTAGAIAMGRLPDISLDDKPANNGGGNNDTTRTQSQATTMTLPPHLRPSAPRAPDGTQTQVKLRELTENEERMRRESGMTHADFLGLIDLKPHEVIDSKIGVPQKAGK